MDIRPDASSIQIDRVQSRTNASYSATSTSAGQIISVFGKTEVGSEVRVLGDSVSEARFCAEVSCVKDVAFWAFNEIPMKQE